MHFEGRRQIDRTEDHTRSGWHSPCTDPHCVRNRRENKGAEHLLLAGVKTRGIYLAQRIAAKLGEVEGKAPPVLELDVTPWRDDVPRTDAPSARSRSAYCRRDRHHRGRCAVHRTHRACRHRSHLTEDAPSAYSWLCWSIAVTANCRCGRIISAKTCLPRVMNAFCPPDRSGRRRQCKHTSSQSVKQHRT